MAKVKSVPENISWSIRKLEKKRQTKKEGLSNASNAIKNMRTEEEKKPRLPRFWDGRIIKN